ncbi:TPA: D-amino-acid transaminase [Kluyvera intermedia]|uniref:Aminodeoxychorismate lyase n=2 Tax=Enterobacteriaceae TaxID=543 RepID=A0AAC8QR90_9ENTR|nr:D-amino-acid transaminase [Phytobacter ursingii]HAT2207343.1 D-amino-acid transaminase [Kluyvera intermedia]AKL13485.1 D-amino acid aminotransferase [Phytobacter ursingii]HAT2518038.1 D-amino-acid transaminase [Kluyvera intermedia]HAT2606191.1 D-amino-acid transaminase [Kluyvera intermedia]HAT2682979.1 D-amino-acid transaminase [Kluyvera intermedia]
MSRTVYLNGEYVPEEEAKISVFDRGFLFADAVYEVTAVVNGKLVDFAGHFARLARSCRELGLPLTLAEDDLREIHQRLIVENRLTEGGIYLQLTRGNSGDRDFHFPSSQTPTTLVLFTQSRAVVDHPAASKGIRVVTCPDIRWQRRDIKTVQLLAPCLAKAWAEANGADDAFLVEDGFITEGSSCNCYIVTADKTIVTRPLSNNILHGITRKALFRLSEEHGITFEERLFTPEEARRASEVFISSATTFVWPVVSVDGQQIGDGKPGEITKLLRRIYLEMVG